MIGWASLCHSLIVTLERTSSTNKLFVISEKIRLSSNRAAVKLTMSPSTSKSQFPFIQIGTLWPSLPVRGWKRIITNLLYIINMISIEPVQANRTCFPMFFISPYERARKTAFREWKKVDIKFISWKLVCFSPFFSNGKNVEKVNFW